MVVAVLGLVLGLFFRNVYYLFLAQSVQPYVPVGEAMPAHLGEDISRLQPVLCSRYWLWVHVKVSPPLMVHSFGLDYGLVRTG